MYFWCNHPSLCFMFEMSKRREVKVREAKIRDRMDLEVGEIGLNVGKSSLFRDSKHLCELSDRVDNIPK